MHELQAILPSFETVAYLVNLALAVTLVSGGGLGVARLCRRGSAPVRHGVLMGTLGLLLLAPAAVWLAQLQGLGLLRITLASPPSSPPTSGDLLARNASGMAGRPQPSRSMMAPTLREGLERPLFSTTQSEISNSVETPASQAAPAVLSESSRPATDSTAVSGFERSASPAWWQVVAGVVAGLWALGMLVGLGRLGWGYLALARFCRRLMPLVDPRQQSLVRQAAEAMGLGRTPAVFLSPLAGVPVSIGLWKPAVVLPEALPREVEEEQLQAVLLHEMAHLARRDPWVGLAQRLATVLFWWQPLVHRICDGISELREEICDNHVVLVQGEGRRLARLLVDLATRVTCGPLLPATVGVLEPKLAGLTGRVTRLLDKERKMETRMDLRSKVLLFSGSLLVLTGMAAVGGLRLTYAQSATAAGSAATAGKAEAKAPEQFDFRGQVLDPEGKPLPGAKVYFVFHPSHRHPESEPPKLRATSGPDGHFQFTLSQAEFDSWRAEHPFGVFDDVSFRNDCRLVAQADGYGPVWLPAHAFETSGELRTRMLQAHPQDAEAMSQKIEPVLRLVKDDVPLEGRIVDPQGKPVAGVQVRVWAIQPVKGEDLTDWLETAEKEGADYVQTMEYLSRTLTAHGSFTDGAIASEELPQIAATATSDAEGKVRLTGIGRERLAVLVIEGPGVETSCMVQARTRPGRTLTLPYQLPHMPEKFTVYGATFERVVLPSLPIVGTVRDKDTGKPLAGVTVQAFKLSGSAAHDYVVRRFLHTTTDAQGGYRLTGLPLGSDNEVLVVPPADQPYLLSKKVVDTSAGQGQDSVRVDVELKRGVWIRGKVSDAKTGAPVPCCFVEYVTFPDNPACQSAPGFEGAYQLGLYETDPEGRYAVRGLPGRGIVAVQAWEEGETHYPLGAGAEKIPEVHKAGETLKKVVPHELYTYSQHAFAEVNPAEGVESIQQDFQLDPGQTLTGTVLDPEGKPLSGAHYSGLQEQGGWEQLSAETFKVNGYRPDRGRQLRLVHLERKLAGSLHVKGDASAPLNVKLQPWGVLTGRALDADGKPLAKMEINSYCGGFPQYLRVKGAGGESHRVWESFLTDAEGRFRIEGLAPGMEYGFYVRDPRSGELLGQSASDLTVEAGQTRDLGDYKMKPTKVATK